VKVLFWIFVAWFVLSIVASYAFGWFVRYHRRKGRNWVKDRDVE
jgi:hypothetical protein